MAAATLDTDTLRDDAPYDDRHCLLYGLRDAHFAGARSTEGSDYSSSLDDLLGSFHAAQTNACARRSEGAGPTDNKILRKLEWAAHGVPANLLVPTLLTCDLELDESTRVAAAEFIEDENGDWVPCMSADAISMRPSQGHEACEATLLRMVEAASHGVIIKPVLGANSIGVLLLSLAHDSPLAPLPLASGQPRPASAALAMRLPADHMWATAPVKNARVQESALAIPLERWFDECVLHNHALVGGESSGLRRFLAEPVVAHDQELCVLSVNGGRLQVLAGRANCMERLLMLQDEPTFVAASDFSPPSCRSGSVLDEEARKRCTAMVLEQRVAGDVAGRTVHEAVRQTVVSLGEGLGEGLGASAFRADFFVRFGAYGSDQPCTLTLNEVEHAFSAGSAVGWFGAPSVDLALRAWALGGDRRQRERFEAELKAELEAKLAASAGADERGLRRTLCMYIHRYACTCMCIYIHRC